MLNNIVFTVQKLLLDITVADGILRLRQNYLRKLILFSYKINCLYESGLTQKLPKILIYRTAKSPRTPRKYRVCVSPMNNFGNKYV